MAQITKLAIDQLKEKTAGMISEAVSMYDVKYPAPKKMSREEILDICAGYSMFFAGLKKVLLGNNRVSHIHFYDISNSSPVYLEIEKKEKDQQDKYDKQRTAFRKSLQDDAELIIDSVIFNGLETLSDQLSKFQESINNSLK